MTRFTQIIRIFLVVLSLASCATGGGSKNNEIDLKVQRLNQAINVADKEVYLVDVPYGAVDSSVEMMSKWFGMASQRKIVVALTGDSWPGVQQVLLDSVSNVKGVMIPNLTIAYIGYVQNDEQLKKLREAVESIGAKFVFVAYP